MADLRITTPRGTLEVNNQPAVIISCAIASAIVYAAVKLIQTVQLSRQLPTAQITPTT